MPAIKLYSIEYFLTHPSERTDLAKGYLLRRDVTDLIDRMGEDSKFPLKESMASLYGKELIQKTARYNSPSG